MTTARIAHRNQRCWKRKAKKEYHAVRFGLDAGGDRTTFVFGTCLPKYGVLDIHLGDTLSPACTMPEGQTLIITTAGTAVSMRRMWHIPGTYTLLIKAHPWEVVSFAGWEDVAIRCEFAHGNELIYVIYSVTKHLFG
jgi:hypothetical protein